MSHSLIPTPADIEAEKYRRFQKPIEAQIELIVEAMKAGESECAAVGNVVIPPDMFLMQDAVLPHVVTAMRDAGWRIDYDYGDKLSWKRSPTDNENISHLLASAVRALHKITDRLTVKI